MKINLEPLTRFIQHLPKSGDLELSLLKCHLLVEEVLTKLISRNVEHPEHLLKARLSFSQKISLARSLNDLGEEHSWIWVAAKKLNDARNELAHGLRTEEIQDKLESFVSFVESDQGKPEAAVVTQAFGRFQWAVFKVFTLLAAHAHFDYSQFKIGPATTLLTAGAEQAVQPDRREDAAPG